MIHLSCPVCASALHPSDTQKSLRCSNGHSFDMARQGYVNLLLNPFKKSKHPGDSAEMVAARTQFLTLGLYERFADSVCQVIADHMDQSSFEAKTEPYHFLDVGCGEGYYTEKIAKALHATNRQPAVSSQTPKMRFAPLTVTGIDISTPAIKACCKRSKNQDHPLDIQWAIASANKLPVPDLSLNLVSFLFCRVALDQAWSKLKPGGHLLVASTGPNHLIEMRTALYDSVKTSQAFQVPESLNSALIKHVRVEYSITIDHADDMKSLLLMTPHVWRSAPEKQAQLCQSAPMTLSLDFDIKLLEKVSDH